MEKFIDIDRAIELIIANTGIMNKEIVKLEDSFNRILASDLYTDIPIPNFRKSPYDGYCLKSSLSKDASLDNPTFLTVSGTIKAGDDISRLPEGTYKIMTGAEVPSFCDYVVKKEDTDLGSRIVAIYKEGNPGDNIIKVGEDVPAGTKIAETGNKITSGMVAMLSAMGISELKVYRLPKIGLITSGDEVIDLDDELKPGQIYNSNKYALLSYINELGIMAKDYGVASDVLEDLKDKISSAMEENDVIITTGGVSVGDFDFIDQAYEVLNIDRLFWAVKMKPGTPVMAGKSGKKLIISLPGSPAASLITYEVIAKPAIRYMMGYREYVPRRHHGVMKEGFKKTSEIPRLLRVRVSTEDMGYSVYLSGKQNAGVLYSMLNFNALALVLNPDTSVKKGDIVEFFFVKEECL